MTQQTTTVLITVVVFVISSSILLYQLAKMVFQYDMVKEMQQRIQFEKEYSNTEALAAYGAGAKYTYYVAITNAEREEYGPFTRCRIFNKSKTNDILVLLNHDSNKAYRLGPGEIVNIDGILFSFVSIINTSTTSTIAIGDVKIRIANFA